jgi:hypothetical protein
MVSASCLVNVLITLRDCLGMGAGVGISVDGGQTFKTFNAQLTTEARYGAFPTDTTWYVAAGTCIAVYMPRCLRVDCME